jgi:HD superfamily phosphohydrolase
MMRDICTRLLDVDSFNRPQCPIIDGLKGAFPDTFTGSLQTNTDLLINHLLVAALIQDIGELPYNVATANFFKPSPRVVETVTNAFAIELTNCEPKIVFALQWLQHRDNSEHLAGLSLPLLAYLISGRRPHGISDFRGLRAIRHMTDGAVDADRLDYVHRDAFHTVGVKRSPEAIIASLLYYYDDGPVFSSPGAVSDFLATRAILWSSIYLAPSNRFRVILFSQILRGLQEPFANSGPLALQGLSAEGLDYETLPQIDDLLMDDIIRAISHDKSRLRTGKAVAAAEALTRTDTPYDYFWLGASELSDENVKIDFDFTIPNDLFRDSYSDYQSHTLYAHRSIRIAVDHFRYLGGTATLEDCSGPFNAMLTERSSALPMPGRLLLFRPTNPPRLPIWAEMDRRIMDSSLFYRLKYEDRKALLDFTTDTRKENGFHGRALFISFAFEDIHTVKFIAAELHRRRHRYHCLLEPYSGLGNTARTNSVQAIISAEAVLMLYSSNYAGKFRNEPNGALAAECFAMTRRYAEDPSFKIIPLSLENYRNIGPAFPWPEIGFAEGGQPMVGPALRNAPNDTISAAIDHVIKGLN